MGTLHGVLVPDCSASGCWPRPPLASAQECDSVTFAGSRESRWAIDGTGYTVDLDFPQGTTADRGGNTNVAVTGNHTLRKITPDGVATTLAGQANLASSADGINW